MPKGPITAHHPVIQAILPILGINPSKVRGFTLRCYAEEVVTVHVEQIPTEDDMAGVLAALDRYEVRARSTPSCPPLKLFVPLVEEDARPADEPQQSEAGWTNSTDLASDWLDGLHRLPEASQRVAPALRTFEPGAMIHHPDGSVEVEEIETTYPTLLEAIASVYRGEISIERFYQLRALLGTIPTAPEPIQGG